jgi:hypothetical protein
MEKASTRPLNKDPEKINAFLSQQDAFCVHCLQKAPEGTPVQIDARWESYDVLKSMGFSLPPIE